MPDWKYFGQVDWGIPQFLSWSFSEPTFVTSVLKVDITRVGLVFFDFHLSITQMVFLKEVFPIYVLSFA